MSNYSGPARGPDESFKEYKQRQKLAALVLRNRRRGAAGGSMTSRARRRSNPDFKAGTYGESLMAHFAAKQATPARLKTHKAYLARIAARKAARAQR